LGTVLEAGRNLVPKPATGIMALVILEIIIHNLAFLLKSVEKHPNVRTYEVLTKRSPYKVLT
jgi:hypothetical protein